MTYYFFLDYVIVKLVYYVYISGKLPKGRHRNGSASHHSSLEARQRNSSTSSLSSVGSFTVEPSPSVFYTPCDEDSVSVSAGSDRAGYTPNFVSPILLEYILNIGKHIAT